MNPCERGPRLEQSLAPHSAKKVEKQNIMACHIMLGIAIRNKENDRQASSALRDI